MAENVDKLNRRDQYKKGCNLDAARPGVRRNR
jgi:hypothetical protein